MPGVLRGFYGAWGARDDLVRSRDRLLRPEDIFVLAGAGVVCVEDQGTAWWGISLDALHAADDPPVDFALDREPPLQWLPSHARSSWFLDGLTYASAFAGGAVHGGVAAWQPGSDAPAQLQRHWTALTLESHLWGLIPSPGLPKWLIYARDGQAVHYDSTGIWVAARTTAQLASIREELQIEWSESW